MLRAVTLGVLVHWAGRGSHPAVTPWSHAHTLHLSIAGVIGHPLLMHGFHGLIQRESITILGYCIAAQIKRIETIIESTLCHF